MATSPHAHHRSLGIILFLFPILYPPVYPIPAYPTSVSSIRTTLVLLAFYRTASLCLSTDPSGIFPTPPFKWLLHTKSQMDAFTEITLECSC